MDTRAYQITDRPGATLVIGRPAGRKRPALYVTVLDAETGKYHTIILAQFHGDHSAIIAGNFLDEFAQQVQRVIDHLAKGDAT